MSNDRENGLNGKVERVADDVWFRLAARGSMLALGFMGLPLLWWIGGGTLNAVESLKKEQAAMTTSLRVLEATIQLQMVDRYRGDDARRDFQIRDLRLKSLEDVVGKLDRSVEKIQERGDRK